MAAVGVTKSKLSDQRIIVFGAGTAGLGITCQLRDAMVTIDKISRDEANKNFYLVDKEGLIKTSVAGGVRHGLEDFARSDDEWTSFGATSKIELLDVVKTVKPTVLIGDSQLQDFSQEVPKFILCRLLDEGWSIYGGSRSRNGKTRRSSYNLPPLQP